METAEKMSDIVTDGITEEPMRADIAPQLDFCRRHYSKCIIVGATSMIVVTATVITCAVVVGYKISKETITFQYGTVVFRTTGNTSVAERVTVHEAGLDAINPHGEAMIVFDYPHFLMLMHFSKLDGVCFVTKMNETWTKIFGLKHDSQETLEGTIPDSIWYLRTDNVVDKTLVPVSIRRACWRKSYWMTKSNNMKGSMDQNIRPNCKPLCLTFCFSPKSACIKVCLHNPCSKQRSGNMDYTTTLNRTGDT